MRSFVINKNDSGQRLDKYISKAIPALPMSLMYKFIRTKKIKVNRARTQQNYMLCEGDEVLLFIREEFFDVPTNDSGAFMRIVPKLSILYEDENIILCNKRPGILVHEDKDENENTLIMHIKAYLVQKGEYSPDSERSFAPALCNRIDRNTGGIVIAAKNAEALRIINEKIKNNEVSKFYLCILHGVPEKRSDTLHAYLRKDSTTNTVKVFDREVPGSKEIITKYKVLKVKDDLALTEVELITGRTHQIRAHMSYIGYPLLGDGKYGINKDDKQQGYKYQALYAYRLIFNFKPESTALDYLRGKEISIPPEEIWFYNEF